MNETSRGQRRGGKPKGYKHTGFRLVAGEIHRGEAEKEFLHALNRTLPIDFWRRTGARAKRRRENAAGTWGLQSVPRGRGLS